MSPQNGREIKSNKSMRPGKDFSLPGLKSRKGAYMKIAAYCRVSTDKDEQLDSLENQKQFFAEYAEKHGHKLVRLYADEGISGTSLKKRNEFQRLLADAELGIFEMVVVKDISRFARNTVDFLQSIRTLKSYGVNTLFLTANMESLGESEFVLTVFGALAQEESINLSKRVKFGKKINAQKGRVPQRIFGYNRIDNFTLEINPEEAETVRLIYDLYLNKGFGCRTISMELNRLGRKTKYDYEWNPKGVRRVLTNSIYCGKYVNNKYEIEDCISGKQIHIPQDQHYHHDRPEWAIISEEIFANAQKLLSQRRKYYDSGTPFVGARYSSKHIFSTLIKCEHCGRSFVRKHYACANGKNDRVYWKCPTNDQYTAEKCDNRVTINEDELTEEIRTYISNLIKDENTFVNGVLADLKKNVPKSNDVSPEEIERKKKLLLAKKEKYQDMYAADVMSMAELKKKISTINEEFKKLDYSLEEYQKNLSVREDSEKLLDEYRKEVNNFLKLNTVTNMDMRKIIDHISVNKNGEIKIYIANFDNVKKLPI